LNLPPPAVSVVSSFLVPLDRARSRVLSAALQWPWLGKIVRDRHRRIGARATTAILLALVLTILSPALMLAISPAVFGVPHVASALRYLLLRQQIGRLWGSVMVGGCSLIAALRMGEQWWGAPSSFARAEIAMALVWLLAAAFAGAWQGRTWRRLLVMVPLLALGGAFAVAHAPAARIAFVHVHNLGAVLLWVVLFRRRAGQPLVPVLLLFGALALLLSGVTTSWTERVGGLRAAGVDLAVVGAWLAPGLGAAVAIPLVLAHAFTDSVHYAFWISVVPEETLRGQGTPTFRMTLRGLLRDFTPLGIGLVAFATASVLGASLFDLGGTRNAYFAIAGFHGYVEGVMLVFLLTRGGGRAPRDGRTCEGADRGILPR
jgi:hypothetical protein